MVGLQFSSILPVLPLRSSSPGWQPCQQTVNVQHAPWCFHCTKSNGADTAACSARKCGQESAHVHRCLASVLRSNKTRRECMQDSGATSNTCKTAYTHVGFCCFGEERVWFDAALAAVSEGTIVPQHVARRAGGVSGTRAGDHKQFRSEPSVVVWCWVGGIALGQGVGAKALAPRERHARRHEHELRDRAHVLPVVPAAVVRTSDPKSFF